VEVGVTGGEREEEEAEEGEATAAEGLV